MFNLLPTYKKVGLISSIIGTVLMTGGFALMLSIPGADKSNSAIGNFISIFVAIGIIATVVSISLAIILAIPLYIPLSSILPDCSTCITIQSLAKEVKYNGKQAERLLKKWLKKKKKWKKGDYIVADSYIPIGDYYKIFHGRHDSSGEYPLFERAYIVNRYNGRIKRVANDYGY